MSSNKVINHNTYAEITNGLFFVDEVKQYEPPQELVPITRQHVEEAVNYVFAQYRPRHERDVVLYTGNPLIGDEYNRVLQEEVQRQEERARIENERLSLQLSYMSEQQLLEHFDRISQEEN